MRAVLWGACPDVLLIMKGAVCLASAVAMYSFQHMYCPKGAFTRSNSGAILANCELRMAHSDLRIPQFWNVPPEVHPAIGWRTSFLAVCNCGCGIVAFQRICRGIYPQFPIAIGSRVNATLGCIHTGGHCTLALAGICPAYSPRFRNAVCAIFRPSDDNHWRGPAHHSSGESGPC